MRNGIGHAMSAVIMCALTGVASAINIDLVTVGAAGNLGELSGAGAGGWGPDRVCGAVDYVFALGKYEVTAGQYAAFLNAVAATDPYELYNDDMWIAPYGCKIQRTGVDGSYSYTVAPDFSDRPVNFVSFWDACRFANWLHNGQPVGAAGPATTEGGAYTLDGMMGHGYIVPRNPGARAFIPTEDEWYKGAYYDSLTTTYHDYPTGSSLTPSNQIVDPDPGNNANFYQNGYAYPASSPYRTSPRGEFENSASPFGTFDQGGNVLEWTETLVAGGLRGTRGGSSLSGEFELRAAYREADAYDFSEWFWLGFRVAAVPEPRTMLLLMTALSGTRRR